jgi:hypothetical protein
MNLKRVLIATVIGALCGVYCAYGTATMDDPNFVATTGILVSIFYNRVLIGFVVGIGDGINIHPVLRGGLIGAGVTMTMSIIPLIDGQPMGGLILLVFGIVYGIIADVVATRFS